MATDGNGNEYTPGKCFECRKGEHEDFDNQIAMCRITDPDTGKQITRGNLCGEHQHMYLADGYALR